MTPPYGGETAGVMNNTESRVCERGEGGDDGDGLDFKISSRPNRKSVCCNISVSSASAHNVAAGCDKVNLRSGSGGPASSMKSGGDVTGRSGV
jgi:hypothetical protein